MLLGQLVDLTARIDEITALLDAAITALPDDPPNTDPPANTDANSPGITEGTQPPGPTPVSYATASRGCARSPEPARTQPAPSSTRSAWT